MAIRQSSGASDIFGSVRLGRFSPVSKTSSAANQYAVGDADSPSSAKLGSCAIKLPNKNKVIPRMAWNAVGCSVIKLGLSNGKRAGVCEDEGVWTQDRERIRTLALLSRSETSPVPRNASLPFPSGNPVVVKD